VKVKRNRGVRSIITRVIEVNIRAPYKKADGRGENECASD